MKVPPTKYVIHYRQGKIKREGAGLSFFYFVPASTIVAVPFSSADAPFVFQEVTGDFQPVAIQGQLTYRVADPKKLAALLDFSIDRGGRYLSEDPEKLKARLVHQAQILARAVTQTLTLGQVLTRSREIGAEVMAGLKTSETIAALGVEVLSVSILSVKATPEMSKALEAEAREALQRRSDEAIYARRNAAVEQERRIKESELNTEIAVEKLPWRKNTGKSGKPKWRRTLPSKKSNGKSAKPRWRPTFPWKSNAPCWSRGVPPMSARNRMPGPMAWKLC
jgi:regulator of protease activity HflC (stomatin/prohibitin superfamily)